MYNSADDIWLSDNAVNGVPKPGSTRRTAPASAESGFFSFVLSDPRRRSGGAANEQLSFRPSADAGLGGQARASFSNFAGTGTADGGRADADYPWSAIASDGTNASRDA